MKKLTIGILSFGIGGVVGYLTASILEKSKANKRIEEIKEEFKKSHKIPEKLKADYKEESKPTETKDDIPKIEIEGWAPDKESFKEYSKVQQPYTGATYHAVEKTDDAEKEGEEVITPGPYIVSMEEFDTIGYDVKYWSVFDDDVIETDDGRTIRWMFTDDSNTSELSSILCDDAVYRLSEYDEDVVYVRDDAKRIDYELLKERKNYFKQ